MDSHVHLVISAHNDEECEEEFVRLSKESHEIVVGTRPKDWARILDIHKTNSSLMTGLITGSVGLHPWFVLETLVGNSNGTWLATLQSLLEQNLTLQVGEIGLDKIWSPPEHLKIQYRYEDQVQVFRQQLTLAGNLKRRVSVHCVKAHTQMLDILSNEPNKSSPPLIYLHSWSGSSEITRQFLKSRVLKKRLYFGVSASVNLRGILAFSYDNHADCSKCLTRTYCWHMVDNDTKPLTNSESSQSMRLWKNHQGEIESHPWRASKKWEKFCTMIRLVPPQRLLLESDMPGFKGNLQARKESIDLIAFVVSDSLNVEVQDLLKMCKSNLERFQKPIL
uniref:TatD related DNase n=1 Tax=Aplanochytrium stocchinoi TaxID=215587 RepID=A0A7S3LIT5_9STRA